MVCSAGAGWSGIGRSMVDEIGIESNVMEKLALLSSVETL